MAAADIDHPREDFCRFSAALPSGLWRFVESLAYVAERVRTLFEKAAPALDALANATEQIQNSPPIRGYEAYFIEIGRPRSEARLLAFSLIKLGKVLRQELLAEAKLSGAVRAVAKADGASTLVISRRAKELAQALNKPAVEAPFGNSCSSAGVRESFGAFWELVERAARRDPVACRELTKICKTLAPHLCDPRQRAPSIASSTHELLLEFTGTAYTCNAYLGDMTDRATLATRTAMDDPDFDPTAAARRLKRLKQDQAA
jgi:hypothetical protein